MRFLLFILLICPCDITASKLPDRVKDEYRYTINMGAPCTTVTDVIEGTCDLVVRRKPRIRSK